MKLRALALLCACVFSIAATTGCGDSAGGSPAAAEGGAAASQSNSLSGHKLVGAWEGAIEINEDEVVRRLQEQGEGVDPAETIAILKSMSMNIDFHDDGTMHMSATMNTPGGPQSSGGEGRWEVVSDSGQQVTIKSIEEGREGEVIDLTFVDQDTFTMAPPGANQSVGVMRFRRVEHVAHAGGAGAR